MCIDEQIGYGMRYERVGQLYMGCLQTGGPKTLTAVSTSFRSMILVFANEANDFLLTLLTCHSSISPVKLSKYVTSLRER